MNTESLLPAVEHLVGFLIVMATLTVLWTMTSLMGRWFGQRDAAVVAARVAGASTDDDLVVAAAVAAAMIDAPHRVVSVRRQPSSPSRDA